MRTRWSTLADTLAKVEVVGDTRGDTRSPVDNLAETLKDVEALTLGDTRGYAHALINTLVVSLAEVEELGDAQGDAHEVVDTLADR